MTKLVGQNVENKQAAGSTGQMNEHLLCNLKSVTFSSITRSIDRSDPKKNQ